MTTGMILRLSRLTWKVRLNKDDLERMENRNVNTFHPTSRIEFLWSMLAEKALKCQTPVRLPNLAGSLFCFSVMSDRVYEIHFKIPKGRADLLIQHVPRVTPFDWRMRL